ncbi:MAG TPA: hypothetical protein VFR51_19620 [Pyrinomonadaceae bacterium]|nr:hypothetical protein [Pyrinomonadaceae bacterium]
MVLTTRATIQRLILITLLCGSAIAQTQQTPPKDDESKWKEFNSAEGGFTVSFPGSPKTTVTEVESDLGRPIKAHLFTLEFDDLGFFISFSDSGAPQTPTQREATLDQMRDRTLAKRHRLLSENSITVDGIVGRELLIQREIGLIMRGRYFFAKGRLYYVIITAPPKVAFRNGEPSANPADLAELFDTTSKRFFNSFKLTK